MAFDGETSPSIVVLGGGVVGLSVALTVRERFPSARITIVAEYFPGDYHVDYCSPWAGGNWCSAASDNGPLESFDRVTFNRFADIARDTPEAGIKRSPLRMIYDQKIEAAGILSIGTNVVWYDDLVGGLVPLSTEQLPEGAVFGLDAPATFVINTQVYLHWYVSSSVIHFQV